MFVIKAYLSVLLMTVYGLIYCQDSDENISLFIGISGDSSCTTPNNEQGSCINIRRCQPLLDLLMNLPSNPEAFSFLRDSVCSYEGLDPVICCPSEVTFYESEPEAPPAPSYSLPGIEDNCGANIDSLTTRVVNGVPASLGEFPWIAALGYHSKRTVGKTNWQCGGTLITNRHVVTAAHCIKGHESDIFKVRLGELDLERTDLGANPIDVNIEMLIVHEEYNSVEVTNDIALIKLDQDIEFVQGSIWPICLPKTPEVMENNFERTLPFIAGWGATSYKGPSSSRLQVAQIPVVTNSKCQDAYSRFKNVISETVLCAGYAQGGKDACQGDSGGPLMWPTITQDRGMIQYYLIGIVSFGFKCAEPGYPGVYTRVTGFISWIEEKINE